MNLTNVDVSVCDSLFIQAIKFSYKIVARQILGRTCSLRAQRSCLPPKVSSQTAVAGVSSQGEAAATRHKLGPFQQEVDRAPVLKPVQQCSLPVCRCGGLE